MPTIDYEKEYNVHALVPEHPQISARRASETKAYREEARGTEFNVAYGPSPKQIYDFFPAQSGGDAALAMYIHGGGWQALAPAMMSHMAKGPNAHGVAVALAGYDLAPQVSVATIIDEVRAAALALWRRFHKRIFVYGHSAGGHLVACLVATDWSKIASDVPADLTPAGYAVSGVYDMTPLVHTAQNAVLRLDERSARAVSPLFWTVPPGRTFDAVVGAKEFERIPAAEPLARRCLGQGRRRDALRGNRRRQSLHRHRRPRRSGKAR